MGKEKVNPTYLLIGKTLLTGFFGGFIWGIVGTLMYIFNFTEVTAKSFVLRSWITAEWTNGWLGNIVSIMIVSLLSIIIAMFYYFLFRKMNSMWIGFAYGLLLWFIFFMFLHPLFPNVKQITELNLDTMITTACLFVLYGTFIGYSISYEHYSLFQYRKYSNE